MIAFTAFLLLGVLVDVCICTGNDAGKVGEWDIGVMEACEYENEFDTSLNLWIEKEDDDKTISGNVTIPFDIDASMTFTIKVDRWSGSEWKEDYYTQEGALCEYANKVFSKLFDTVKGNFDPAVAAPQVCNLVKGTYVFEKLQAPADNVNVPTVMYSPYRAWLRLFKGKGQGAMACMYSEFEAFK